MDTLLKSSAIVRFQDCDPYGHLYNGKYIDYFMNAREDQLIEHYELDIYGISEKEGIGWVVAQNQIAYLQPAMLMEKVWITSKLIQHSARAITVEFEMWNTEESRMKALMWSRFVHFDIRNRKSIEHAPRFVELFEAAHHPVEAPTFDERLAGLRKNV